MKMNWQSNDKSQEIKWENENQLNVTNKMDLFRHMKLWMDGQINGHIPCLCSTQ